MNFFNWLDIPTKNIESYIGFYAVGIAITFLLAILLNFLIQLIAPDYIKYYKDLRDSIFQFSLVFIMFLVIIGLYSFISSFDTNCLVTKGVVDICNNAGGSVVTQCLNMSDPYMPFWLGKNSSFNFSLQCYSLHPCTEPENKTSTAKP